jgi:hypothetical protein
MATLSTLTNDVYALLNEASNSVVGDIPNGTGGTTVTTTTLIETYLNEAQNEMARSCVYIPGSNTTAGFTGVDLDLSATSLWFPMSVKVGTAVLQHTSDFRLRAWQPNFETFSGTLSLPNGATTTSPTYWYRKQPMTIGIFPSVSNQTVVVYGASLPPVLSGASPATFLPDDTLRNTLPVYTAMKLAMKNLDDPSLATRIQLWQNWWFDSCTRLWSNLDNSLKTEGSPYLTPPVMPPAAK